MAGRRGATLERLISEQQGSLIQASLRDAALSSPLSVDSSPRLPSIAALRHIQTSRRGAKTDGRVSTHGWLATASQLHCDFPNPKLVAPSLTTPSMGSQLTFLLTHLRTKIVRPGLNWISNETRAGRSQSSPRRSLLLVLKSTECENLSTATQLEKKPARSLILPANSWW